MNEFEDIANDVVKTVFPYGTRRILVNLSFRKTYKSILLAGEYYGVRIVLGSGEYWWCVMYPPLCFKEGEEVKLSKESFEKFYAKNLIKILTI